MNPQKKPLSQLSGLELALFKASADDDLNERLESSELAPLWFNRFNKLRLPNFPAAIVIQTRKHAQTSVAAMFFLAMLNA